MGFTPVHYQEAYASRCPWCEVLDRMFDEGCATAEDMRQTT